MVELVRVHAPLTIATERCSIPQDPNIMKHVFDISLAIFIPSTVAPPTDKPKNNLIIKTDLKHTAELKIYNI
jgi:hypothetical protein